MKNKEELSQKKKLEKAKKLINEIQKLELTKEELDSVSVGCGIVDAGVHVLCPNDIACTTESCHVDIHCNDKKPCDKESDPAFA